MTEKLIACINRMTGRCPDCKRDYNTTHHPNNLDCPNYKPIVLRTFEVKEK